MRDVVFDRVSVTDADIVSDSVRDCALLDLLGLSLRVAVLLREPVKDSVSDCVRVARPLLGVEVRDGVVETVTRVIFWEDDVSEDVPDEVADQEDVGDSVVDVDVEVPVNVFVTLTHPANGDVISTKVKRKDALANIRLWARMKWTRWLVPIP